jgi:5-methylcytosine-specific restriction endonuclease McrA
MIWYNERAEAVLVTPPGATERRARSSGVCMISPVQPPYKKDGCQVPHKDPETRRAYVRDWKRRNLGKVAQSAKEDDARRHANKRAASYGAPGELSIDDVRSAFADGRCYYCGADDALLTIDHVVPLHKKGPNTSDNIVAACRTCNLKKTSRRSSIPVVARSQFLRRLWDYRPSLQVKRIVRPVLCPVAIQEGSGLSTSVRCARR